MGDSKKVVFLIVNGKPLMIEDDEHLFPSDTLITQLRLLRR
jgi:predicted ribosome-associated RNA-binding protein Tma20